MNTLNALLVFCEGAHDVAFVRLVLKHCFGFKRLVRQFSHYPSPFNNLFQAAIAKHAAVDLRLDMAHKFFLPDQVLHNEQHLVLLFNTGGKDRGDKVKPLLNDLWVLERSAGVFIGDANASVSNFRYLFVYDADHLGVDNTLAAITSEFSEVGGRAWLHSEWLRSEKGCGAIQKNNGDIGAYVWCDPEKNVGTLENLLLECFSEGGILGSARQYLASLFPWETDSSDPKVAIAEAARLTKASIVLIGQRSKPGGSMSVIVDQTEFFNAEVALKSTSVMAFTHFLAGFMKIPAPGAAEAGAGEGELKVMEDVIHEA